MTMRASCFSKNGINSLLCSFRLISTLPLSFTACSWKTDLAVSRPIMVILIAGAPLSTGSDNPYCGTPMPVGGRPPHLDTPLANSLQSRRACLFLLRASCVDQFLQQRGRNARGGFGTGLACQHG